MAADDYDIEIITREGSAATFVIDDDKGLVTCEYGGDPADLFRMGVKVGQERSTRWPMTPILPSTGPCE